MKNWGVNKRRRISTAKRHSHENANPALSVDKQHENVHRDYIKFNRRPMIFSIRQNSFLPNSPAMPCKCNAKPTSPDKQHTSTSNSLQKQPTNMGGSCDWVVGAQPLLNTFCHVGRTVEAWKSVFSRGSNRVRVPGNPIASRWKHTAYNSLHANPVLFQA